MSGEERMSSAAQLPTNTQTESANATKYLVIFVLLVASAEALTCPNLNPFLTRALEVTPKNFQLTCDQIEVISRLDVKDFFARHPLPEGTSKEVRKAVEDTARHSPLFTYLGRVYVRLDVPDYTKNETLFMQPDHREEAALLYSTRFYHEAVHVVEYKYHLNNSEEAALREELRLLDAIALEHPEYHILIEYTKLVRAEYKRLTHKISSC
jgi:hypothetical protein